MTEKRTHSSAGSDGEFFESRDFAESNFREMEVQICGATRTVQFSTSDHGGDHPTSPSVAIDWDMARDLATWVLARTGDVAQSAQVRAETIEECAKVADNVWHGGTPQDAAEAIRALASQPSPAATVETKAKYCECFGSIPGFAATTHIPSGSSDPHCDHCGWPVLPPQRLSAATEGVAIEFKYTNWEGRKGIRQAIPLSIRFGKSEWHPVPQWLLLAYDIDRQAEREFAMSDMQFEDGFLPGIDLAPNEPQTFPMWQPIETAPKQSRILYVNRHGEVGHCSWYEAKNDGEEACWWDDERDDEVVPLGWMPQLPVWSASTVSRPTEAMK